LRVAACASRAAKAPATTPIAPSRLSPRPAAAALSLDPPPTQVAQLAGYVSEHSAYHHGETSLQQTIIGLAQVGWLGGGRAGRGWLREAGRPVHDGAGRAGRGGVGASAARLVVPHADPSLAPSRTLSPPPPQDFVGSNNINLLFPSGQFGTRLQGGKDAASARCVWQAGAAAAAAGRGG
jgi:hypothetical protein